MSWGEIAGLMAAAATVVLVVLSAVPLLKLGGVLDELRTVVRDLGASTTPILDELRTTAATTTEEIARLSQVTEELARISENASTMSKQAAEVSTVMSTPLVKTAEVVSKGAHAVGRVGRNVKARAPQRRGHHPVGAITDGGTDRLGSLDATSTGNEHDSTKEDHEGR